MALLIALVFIIGGLAILAITATIITWIVISLGCLAVEELGGHLAALKENQ
jgi:hypothetical protein